MQAGDYLQNGSYRMVMQGDGNLVGYTQASRPVWASNTNGNTPDVLALQSDGNLVLYGGGRALWQSGTYR